MATGTTDYLSTMTADRRKALIAAGRMSPNSSAGQDTPSPALDLSRGGTEVTRFSSVRDTPMGSSPAGGPAGGTPVSSSSSASATGLKGLPKEVTDRIEQMSGDDRIKAEAMMSDYQNRLGLNQQLMDERGEIRDMMMERMGTLGEGLDETSSEFASKSGKVDEQIATSGEGLGGVLGEHLSRMRETGDEMMTGAQQDWDTVKEQYQDRSADAMNVAAQSLNANYDRQIQDATARAKEGDPEAALELKQLKAAKANALGAQLSTIKVAINDRMADINMNMASLKSNARSLAGTFMSYASQLATETEANWLTKTKPALMQSQMLNKAQMDLAISSMRDSGLVGYADFLQSQPVYYTSLGDITAVLSELWRKDEEPVDYSTGDTGSGSGGTGGEPPKKEPRNGLKPLPPDKAAEMYQQYNKEGRPGEYHDWLRKKGFSPPNVVRMPRAIPSGG